MEATITANYEAIQKLTKDLKAAAKLLGVDEARGLVDYYYQIQHFRIASAAQVRSSDSGEPNAVFDWLANNTRIIEANIQRALGTFAAEYTVGQWCQSICGIGPVISAGLLANFDIRKAATVGHFWRFAGLDPTTIWEKGKKRPWNTDLKTLCTFKLGECFVKVKNNDKDFYGKVYHERKQFEIDRDIDGYNKPAAAAKLAKFKIGKKTEAYKYYSTGHLPPAHLHARARRYAVKLFLSHLHHVMYLNYYGMMPPVPFSFEHVKPIGDHCHFIEPPNWPGECEGKSLRDLLPAKKGE